MTSVANPAEFRPTARFHAADFIVFIIFCLMAAPHAQASELARAGSNVADAFHNILNLRPHDATNWRVGVGPTFGPEFEGGRNYEVNPAPLISFRYRDVMRVDNNQVDFTAFDQVFDLGDAIGKGQLDFGPVVNLDFGRHESDSKDLRGMGNIGVSVEVGGYVSFTTDRVTFDAEMSQDIANGHHGADLDLHSSFKIYRGEKLTLAPDVTVTWATARYMKSFFGINEAQSAASGLPAYRAGSGFKNATFSLLASYDLSRHWSLLATAGYKRMLGSAADSPLIRFRGSVDQWTGSTFIVYAF